MLACLTAKVYSGLSFSLSGVGPNVAETQACVRGKNVAFILQVTEHLGDHRLGWVQVLCRGCTVVFQMK